MSKVVRMVDKKHDSKLWSPLDALRAAIEDIEAGKIKPTSLLILYMEDTGEGRVTPGEFVANMTVAEHIAHLAMAHDKALRDWRS